MPGSGLAWDLSGLTNGTVGVVAAPRPSITGISQSGTSLIISGTNGIPNANYYVLISTNLSLPLANWTRLTTNVFDATGAFSFTGTVDSSPRRFYLVQLP
jgi:hypothetical protein